MDKLLLFAPAGQYLTEENALDTVRLDRIAAGIRAKGFALRELPSVRSVETRFAGSDEVRLADAVAALADDSVDLALALRGGFGSQCLLSKLPWNELGSGRALLTGYSDVTVLLNALWTHTGRTTLHGPVGGDFDPERRIEGDPFGALSRAAAAFGPRNEAWRFSFVPEAAYAEGGRRTSGEAASFSRLLPGRLTFRRGVWRGVPTPFSWKTSTNPPGESNALFFISPRPGCSTAAARSSSGTSSAPTA